MRRSHSRISYVRLPKQRCLHNCSLYCRFFLVFALPRFFDVPKFLSHRFAKHFYDVVLRNILRRMFEKNEAFFAACNYGPVGQSAWWLFAWFSYCWYFLRRGFAQAGLGKL